MDDRWILVVEDDELDQDFIGRILQKAVREERSRFCGTGQEALDAADAEILPPALVLLDWRLPGLSSLEVLRHLREHTKTSLVPIVIFSGDVREEAMIEALLAGANSYICKATEYDRMVEDLKAALHYWLDVHCTPKPRE